MTFSIRSLSGGAERGNHRRSAQELVERGIAAETAGDSKEALRHYRRAAELDPEYPPAHLNSGIALQAAGELLAAVEAYDRALAIDPEYAAAHYNRGLAHLRLDDYPHAEADFRAALRFKPSFAEAWVGLANALEALGRDEAALAALKSAIAEREDYSGALFNAGGLARKLGDFNAAVEYERRALEIEPEHYVEHHRLGVLLQGLERPHEAEASYRTALGTPTSSKPRSVSQRS